MYTVLCFFLNFRYQANNIVTYNECSCVFRYYKIKHDHSALKCVAAERKLHHCYLVKGIFFRQIEGKRMRMKSEADV